MEGVGQLTGTSEASGKPVSNNFGSYAHFLLFISKYYKRNEVYSNLINATKKTFKGTKEFKSVLSNQKPTF